MLATATTEGPGWVVDDGARTSDNPYCCGRSNLTRRRNGQRRRRSPRPAGGAIARTVRESSRSLRHRGRRERERPWRLFEPEPPRRWSMGRSGLSAIRDAGAPRRDQHCAHCAGLGRPATSKALPGLDGRPWTTLGGRLVEVEPYICSDGIMNSWERLEAGLPLLGRVHTVLVRVNVGPAGRRPEFANHVEPDEALGWAMRASRGGSQRLRRASLRWPRSSSRDVWSRPNAV